MINKNVIKRLNGKWFVQVNDDFELANVINVCIDLNINWTHQGIKNYLPTTIHEYPFFIGVYKHFPYLSYSYCDFKGCENITDWFFENINNDPEREHLHKILDAWLDGNVIECKLKNDPTDRWNRWSDDLETLNFERNAEYRIKPKATQLPIPDELWRFIDYRYRYAAMDSNGGVYLYKKKPIIMREKGWFELESFSGIEINNINTDGIDWRLSLTERPREVNHES